MTAISERQRARLYIYIKQRKIAKRLYIDKKADTLQKERQCLLRLYSQKARNFTLGDSS